MCLFSPEFLRVGHSVPLSTTVVHSSSIRPLELGIIPAVRKVFVSPQAGRVTFVTCKKSATMQFSFQITCRACLERRNLLRLVFMNIYNAVQSRLGESVSFWELDGKPRATTFSELFELLSGSCSHLTCSTTVGCSDHTSSLQAACTTACKLGSHHTAHNRQQS